MKKHLSVILLTTMLGACVSTEDGSMEDNIASSVSAITGLAGKSWTVDTLGAEKVDLDVISKPRIDFDVEKLQANGYTGCNSFHGGIDLTGPSLSFKPMASTRRACAETGDIEGKFLEMLDKTKNWEIVDNILQFKDSAGEILATFK